MDLFDTDPKDLRGTALEWSSVCKEERKYDPDTSRGGNRKPHRCIFCGKDKKGGPKEIRSHLNAKDPARCLSPCVPVDEPGSTKMRDRLALVAEELERRRLEKLRNEELQVPPQKRTHAVARLSSESGDSSDMPELVDITVESVNEDWATAFGANALSFHLASEPHFRKALLGTAALGAKYVKSCGEDTFFPRRTAFVEGPIRSAAGKLEKRCRHRTTRTGSVYGGLLVSDGWESTQRRPIVNILYTTIGGTKFLKAIDTSGKEKTMEFIADLVIAEIRDIGPELVTAVCMDGACKGAFEYIERAFSHISCFICPTHSLDNFMGDVCSSKSVVQVKGQERCAWGEDIFEETIDDIWFVVKAVTGAHKPLALYRELKDEANKSIAETDEPFKELLKYCETRFASKILMSQRYHLCRPILRMLFANYRFTGWVKKQKRETQDKFYKAQLIVDDEGHFQNVDLVLRVFEPCVRAMRMTDGKKGATLSKIYKAMLDLGGENGFYAKPIDGLEEEIRTKMHIIFGKRWNYFHCPIMTAAYMLDPEYFGLEDFSYAEEEELKKVLAKLAPLKALTELDIRNERSAARVEMMTGQNEFADEIWRDAARQQSAATWGLTYFYKWKKLQWAAARLSALGCSASPCEHSWSIEGWIHNARRNRMKQDTVEMMVKFHSNLMLEAAARNWDDSVFVWEDDMIVEDPEAEQ